MSAETVQAASMAFKKALIGRALGAELSHYLGYPPRATKPQDSGNHRNGRSAKTMPTEGGPVRIEMPRDREGCFEPALIPKQAALHRLRRQNRGHVRAWHDRARDPGLPG